MPRIDDLMHEIGNGRGASWELLDDSDYCDCCAFCDRPIPTWESIGGHREAQWQIVRPGTAHFVCEKHWMIAFEGADPKDVNVSLGVATIYAAA